MRISASLNKTVKWKRRATLKTLTNAGLSCELGLDVSIKASTHCDTITLAVRCGVITESNITHSIFCELGKQVNLTLDAFLNCLNE